MTKNLLRSQYYVALLHAKNLVKKVTVKLHSVFQSGNWR